MLGSFIVSLLLSLLSASLSAPVISFVPDKTPGSSYRPSTPYYFDQGPHHPRSTLFTTSVAFTAAGSDFTGFFSLDIEFLFSSTFPPLPPSSFVLSQCVRLIAWILLHRTHAQLSQVNSSPNDNPKVGLSCQVRFLSPKEPAQLDFRGPGSPSLIISI
ncbi:hypothetical protein EDB82DRAFT_256375 [Fusarium venenatum]|uniref:uncharacterized protein n=1 Tax=Fusarium venenatum TaxID=56646 RepID=UPI001E12B067|nr:hypothetical protein EDB82DRAFT_256375 [Fusarium venenatum]